MIYIRNTVKNQMYFSMRNGNSGSFLLMACKMSLNIKFKILKFELYLNNSKSSNFSL